MNLGRLLKIYIMNNSGNSEVDLEKKYNETMKYLSEIKEALKSQLLRGISNTPDSSAHPNITIDLENSNLKIVQSEHQIFGKNSNDVNHRLNDGSVVLQNRNEQMHIANTNIDDSNNLSATPSENLKHDMVPECNSIDLSQFQIDSANNTSFIVSPGPSVDQFADIQFIDADCLIFEPDELMILLKAWDVECLYDVLKRMLYNILRINFVTCRLHFNICHLENDIDLDVLKLMKKADIDLLLANISLGKKIKFQENLILWQKNCEVISLNLV